MIDLDTCVGCQACATSCKEWNTGGYSAPLTDQEPYGADPHGAWLNRVHGYEVGEGEAGRTVHFPRSCLHCETPACVTVCPTGASYKRAEDGIVLVNPDTCIGCKLCSWACPYGAREYDYSDGVMKKCTLCVDRIYNETFAPEDRVPACVRACPTGARHFGDLGDPDSAVSQAGGGARRLRSAAGVRLQAGQQVPAAAAAREREAEAAVEPVPPRRDGARTARRWPGRAAVRLGRPRAVALITPHASRLFGDPVHDGVRRGLRAARVAGARRRPGCGADADRWLGLAGFGLALALITAGLLSSTAHLGRPERAWRAFSQWRTSWLSREGVMAVVTYVPAVFWPSAGCGWSEALRADRAC